jgi:hypothetical protein
LALPQVDVLLQESTPLVRECLAFARNFGDEGLVLLPSHL